MDLLAKIGTPQAQQRVIGDVDAAINVVAKPGKEARDLIGALQLPDITWSELEVVYLHMITGNRDY